MGIKIHPRYFKVEEAKNLLGLEMLRMEEGHDLTIEAMVETFLQIAVETNRAGDLKSRKLPKLDEVGQKFLKAVLEAEKEYELTAAETVKIMLELAMRTQVYAIRLERHPNDPDKKGDEA